jgi:hypothetical protein
MQTCIFAQDGALCGDSGQNAPTHARNAIATAI